MKTLHQVEPRTAIAGGTGGVIISTSGAYYLTGNIIVASGDGISIAANHVTLDLNGFSITSNAGAGIGIAVAGTSHLTILNGSISGFLAGVAPTTGMLTPRNVRVANLTVSDCANWGVLLEISKNTRIENCLVDGAVGGIQGTLVSDCSVNAGSISARIVKDCAVSGATLTGITAEVAENCYATSAGTAIQAKCLSNSYGAASGFSSYGNHTVSAGAVSNVWAEGQGGTGDALNATVVNNSIGKRLNDPNPVPGAESNANAQGSGISGTTVLGSVGTSTFGSAITSQITALSSGTTSVGKGITGSLVIGSHGLGTGANSYGIEADLISQCLGQGENGGVLTDRGVIAHSIARSSNSNFPVTAGKAVVIGVNATNDDIFGGIILTGGLAVNSYANGFGIQVPDGLVAQSVARRVIDVGDSGQAAIKASTVTGSRGTGSTSVVGIFADLIDGSFGSGTGGTTTGTLEFNSN
jgi:hypothetical protein